MVEEAMERTMRHTHRAIPGLSKFSRWKYCVVTGREHNERSHGNSVRRDVCRCGAVRLSEHNGGRGRSAYGPWINEQAVDQLAQAILNAVMEHGQPNRFSTRELHRLYGGPTPSLSGRIGRHYTRSLLRSLRELVVGSEWGSPPVYDAERREFVV